MDGKKTAWIVLAAFITGAAAWLNIRKKNRQDRKNYRE